MIYKKCELRNFLCHHFCVNMKKMFIYKTINQQLCNNFNLENYN